MSTYLQCNFIDAEAMTHDEYARRFKRYSLSTQTDGYICYLSNGDVTWFKKEDFESQFFQINERMFSADLKVPEELIEKFIVKRDRYLWTNDLLHISYKLINGITVNESEKIHNYLGIDEASIICDCQAKKRIEKIILALISTAVCGFKKSEDMEGIK